MRFATQKLVSEFLVLNVNIFAGIFVQFFENLILAIGGALVEFKITDLVQRILLTLDGRLLSLEDLQAVVGRLIQKLNKRQVI